MSLKPTQLIVAGFAGAATAFGVAFATIQSQSAETGSARSPQPSNTPTLSSPAPNPPASPSPVAIAPPDNPESPAVDTPTSPKPQPVVVSPPSTPQPQPVVVSPPSTPKPQPVVVSPPESGCKISMALVADPNPPLNVRDRPQVTDNNIVGKLNNNTFVSVSNEQNGWLQITDPVAGWISKNRTKSSCPNVKQRISFVAGGTEAIVQGQIIGGGSHSYLINASKGQTMTVTNRKQVFPIILTPDAKVLAEKPNAEGQTTWTGKVPVTGDYILELDSNFKGFEYEFSIELN
ncbi:MAG TPA: SH3 domain-containing protein [Kamptonema sp.]|nr:SH3 domain-containing protein [Kamptonema sp.]